MQNLIELGRIADLILVILVVETIALLVLFGRSRRGSAMTVVGNAIAGGGLVVALRAALVEASWGWVGAALVLSLVGHLLDLWGRYSRHSGATDGGPIP